MYSETQRQMMQTAQEFVRSHRGVCHCGGTLYFFGFGPGSKPRRTTIDRGVTLACAEVVCGYSAGYSLTADGKIPKHNPLTKHDEMIVGYLPL